MRSICSSTRLACGVRSVGLGRRVGAGRGERRARSVGQLVRPARSATASAAPRRPWPRPAAARARPRACCGVPAGRSSASIGAAGPTSTSASVTTVARRRWRGRGARRCRRPGRCRRARRALRRARRPDRRAGAWSRSSQRSRASSATRVASTWARIAAARRSVDQADRARARHDPALAELRLELRARSSTRDGRVAGGGRAARRATGRARRGMARVVGLELGPLLVEGRVLLVELGELAARARRATARQSRRSGHEVR